MTEPQFSSETKNELDILHRRFEAKKSESIPERSEKEVFRDVFRERFNELKQSIQALAPSTGTTTPKNNTITKDDDNDDDTDDDKDKNREEKLQTLIELSFSESPIAAIGEAQKLGDYYLDELHDRLVDEYYEKLIQFQKLKKLQ